ncbi:hypothetical protein Tco_0770293 [Tanacetum coccineum]|uniref:Uncharacterized protein n=1 Tax=Tanacetum coccineum TaxID=301880 RepID=A0ABQ4ZFC9_9ASTR
MAPLQHRDLRHPWLIYQVDGYDEGIIHSYEQRLETIWGRPVNLVQVLDFARLTDGIRQTLGDRLSMVYAGDDGHALFTSHAWRRLFENQVWQTDRKGAYLEAKNDDIWKIITFDQYRYCPGKEIRRISAKSSQENAYSQFPIRRIHLLPYAHRFIMDDPNITIEEYIRLEEDKARRQGRTFDWQTAMYGKAEYYENEDDTLTNLETEYPAIVFDDISDVAFSREPTISLLDNNEIDFNISFDESDDEDYMIVFDENSFSCKIISVDNLKTDLENGNDKINIPSSPSPEPTIGYFDDLDFFKGFENEFPAIVYNDLKSKSDPLNEPYVDGYDEGIVHSYEQRLKTIWGTLVNWVHGLDFAGLTDGIKQTLGDRLSMVYAGDDGQALFTSHAWKRLFENQHRFIMDDPNITMEEYIRLEEEKARRQGRTFDWQTARYDKTGYYETKDDSFTDLETEYPAIVFDDISDAAFSR